MNPLNIQHAAFLKIESMHWFNVFSFWIHYAFPITMRKGFLFSRAHEMFVLLLALTMLSCSADSTGRRNRAALGGGWSRVRQVGKWTWQRSASRQDETADRRTGEAVRKPQKSGSHPDPTARLAGVRPQRHTGLCPRTAVHPLIGDGSKLFWSKIISRRGRAQQSGMFSSVVRSQLLCAEDGLCVCVVRVKGRLWSKLCRTGSAHCVTWIENYSWDENPTVQMYLLLDCVIKTEEKNHQTDATSLFIFNDHLWVSDCWPDRRTRAQPILDFYANSDIIYLFYIHNLL